MFDWSAAAAWTAEGVTVVAMGVREIRQRLAVARKLDSRIRHLEQFKKRTGEVTTVLIRAHSRALTGLQAGRTPEETLRDLLGAHRQAVEELANLPDES